MDLIDIIVIALLIYNIVGWLLRQQVNKELETEIRAHLDEKIRVVRLETIAEQQDLILAFDGENDRFLAQGQTEDEVQRAIMQRFPNNIFLMNQKPFSALDLKDFGLKNESSNSR